MVGGGEGVGRVMEIKNLSCLRSGVDYSRFIGNDTDEELLLLTLIYMAGGGGQITPGSFFAAAQKRLELDC